MAEPFSVATAAISLVDVALRFGKYISELRNKAKAIDQELEDLNFKVTSCEQIGRAIGAAYNEMKTTSHAETAVWEHLGQMLSHTERLISQMDGIVKAICTPASHKLTKRLDGWLQAHRLLSKDDDLKDCERTLGFFLGGMEIILQRIDQRYARQAYKQTAASLGTLESQFDTLQAQVADLSDRITACGDAKYSDFSLGALNQLLSSIESFTNENTYFSMPQSVQSFFTGREELLKELSTVFIQSSGPLYEQGQRRFVIHGMGGSGKTQFCCKFADMNRHRFWGVFWVDGSSEEALRKGFEGIAKIQGRGTSMKAAMDRLSNIQKRWLLLIDNADNGSLKLEDYFPQSRGGHILITTQSPQFKMHGNVGPRYYNFHGLQIEEASNLLLKTSDLPRPWKSSWADLASTITEALGCLVLAIIQAGAAIRDHLCDLETYMEYFDEQWKRLGHIPTMEESTDNERAVFVTFELCYGRLENRGAHIAAAEAMDLLRIFAFLWRDGLSLEIFDRAMSNVNIEAIQEEEDRQESNFGGSTSLWRTASTLASIFASVLGRNREPPLPALIRDGRLRSGSQESRDRVRRAVRELTQLSLISYNHNDETYTMHPLVHKWARERVWDHKRPEMTLAGQALWAELAGQVLAASILMPPLVMTSQAEAHHFKLFAHVEHVQKFRTLIAEKMDVAQGAPIWMKWLRTGKSTNASRMRMLAKFCVVYNQCGYANEARVLLEEVVHFLCQNLGMKHRPTRLATTALSGIYWELGQPERALQLQRGVVDACQGYFGSGHRDTLVAWHTLGGILWQQGRITEAARWQRKAVSGLRALREKNKSHAVKGAMLEAIDDLGRTVAKFWRPQDMAAARDMHAEAVRGMREMQHPRTSFAMENLARVSALLGENLPTALDMAEEVIAVRQARNGKEAPWTLMAQATKASVLGAIGRFGEAESLMRSTLAIAKRNVGEDHIGVLFGRQILAVMVCRQGRYTEAEQILVDTSRRQRQMSSRRGDHHPDRIVSLVELARCRQLQGKHQEGIEACDEAIEALDCISETAHPFKVVLMVARAQMVGLVDGGGDAVASHGAGVVFPEPCFKSPARSG